MIEKVIQCMHLFIQLLHHVRNETQGQSFWWSTAGLNSEFFLQRACLIKAKELSLAHYLHISGRATDGFMPFSGELAQSEIQTTLSRI